MYVEDAEGKKTWMVTNAHVAIGACLVVDNDTEEAIGLLKQAATLGCLGFSFDNYIYTLVFPISTNLPPTIIPKISADMETA